MHKKTHISFITLLLMISFASVNAVLFTPALPEIANFFSVTSHAAQLTMTWFLVGYALGQLIYGPIANRFGRKPALFLGISLQIMSSLLCALSGNIHHFLLLVVGRLLLALGSGVGLKMTFTLVHECYDIKIANQKIAYLMLAFAITPGLGVALGGILTTYYGWTSCFYAGALYGFILLCLVARLPETQTVRNVDALKIKHLLHEYGCQFKNFQLVMGGLLMGATTCFVYVFAALAPFIAIRLLGMNSSEYGTANILPTIGLVLGSLSSAQFAKKYSPQAGIRIGIFATSCSAILMLMTVMTHQPPLISLFVPQMLSYFGLSFLFSNASSIAMQNVSDKAHASAVMSFINMGSATIVVLSLGFFITTEILLPILYIVICGAMISFYQFYKIKYLPKIHV